MNTIFKEQYELKQTPYDFGDAVRKIIVSFRDYIKERDLKNVYVLYRDWAGNSFVSGDTSLQNSFKFSSTDSFWGTDYDLEFSDGVYVKNGEEYSHNDELMLKLNDIIKNVFKEDMLPHILKDSKSLEHLTYLNGEGVYFKDDEMVEVSTGEVSNYDNIDLNFILRLNYLTKETNLLYDSGKDTYYIKRDDIGEMQSATRDPIDSHKIGEVVRVKTYLNGSESKKEGSISTRGLFVVDGTRIIANYAKTTRRLEFAGIVNLPYVHKNTGLGTMFSYDTTPLGKQFDKKRVIPQEMYDAFITKEFKGIAYDTFKSPNLRTYISWYNYIVDSERELVVDNGEVILTLEKKERTYAKLGLSFAKTDSHIVLTKNDESLPNFEALREKSPEVLSNYGKIREYDYKAPKLNFINVNAESNPLYLGVEIEIDSGGKDSNKAKILQVLWDNYKGNTLVKRDGSLHSGLELVSHPATLASHKDESMFDYRGMFKGALALGYTGSGNDTAGIHVHVNKDFFTYPEVASSIMYAILENDWANVVKIAGRSGSDYARNKKALDKSSIPTNFNTLAGVTAVSNILDRCLRIYVDDRYSCINTSNRHTIEFRFFKSTLNIKAFYAILDFVDSFSRYVEEVSVEYTEMLNSSNINPQTLRKVVKTSIENIIEYSGNKDLSDRYYNGSHDDNE